VEAIRGDEQTLLVGQVNYASKRIGQREIVQFIKTIIFTTGNAVDVVKVRFKANPVGTGVMGTIYP
jgi:hypothetical protein